MSVETTIGNPGSKGGDIAAAIEIIERVARESINIAKSKESC